MASSFASRFYLGSYFSVLKQRICTGQNSADLVNAAVARSPIQSNWPWKVQKCNLVRSQDDIALFSSPNGAIYITRCGISPIIRHSEACDLFALLWVVEVDRTGESQKAVTITSPADRAVFDLFDELPG